MCGMRGLAAPAPEQRWWVIQADSGERRGRFVGQGTRERHRCLVQKWLASSRQQPQSTDQAWPFCMEVCRHDRLEFESNDAASRNGTSDRSHSPSAWLCHLYTKCCGDTSVLQSPPVRPWLSHTHLGRDLPSGDDPSAHSACVHTVTDTRARSLLSQTGGSPGQKRQ